MRRYILLFLSLVLLSPFHSILGDEDSIFLEKIFIVGNNTTRENYIRSRLTLQEGLLYDFDHLMDEINESRQNLEKSGLFSNIFFNDELDNLNNLTLTLQLKEKNYFLFGPSGYLGFENNEFYSVSSLYSRYTNLFGNGSHLLIEFPLYRDAGLILRQDGVIKRVKYSVGFEYRDAYYLEETYLAVTMGTGFIIKENHTAGVNFRVSSTDSDKDSSSTTSFSLFPFFEAGFNRRYTPKIRKWYYFQLSPFIGYNSDSSVTDGSISTFSGVSFRLNIYRDLLFKIIYAPKIRVCIEGGDVTGYNLFNSDVRGTFFDAYRGTFLLSVSNELEVPLPTNTSITFVPFLDSDLIGDGNGDAEFLIGGGIGLHWYTRYQDPLIIDISFGKGIMLNFKSRF